MALASLLTPSIPRLALARSGGNQGGGCVGCHSEGSPSLSLTADREVLTPGEEVTFTLTVSSSGAGAAGVFVDAEGVGTFRTISGEGLAEVEAGLTHFMAKPASGGSVSFRFAWTPPNSPGGVHFGISAVAANGDGRSTGDAAGQAAFDFVFGCEPSTFYADLDGDGSGRAERPRLDCVGAQPEGLSPDGDDCNDNNPLVFPGSDEFCNNIDDNCNGEVDEDSLPVDQYPDADGDGYYSASERASGESVSGCLEPGYAFLAGDCQPNEPSIHPGAEEVCNQYDDDCDGDVDEGVRPQCGEGWCLRDATTCDGSICAPGEPRSEECNLFDDDCDGDVDEGASCPDGEACIAGLCRPEAAGSAGVAGASGSTGSSSSSSSEGTDGSGGQVQDASGAQDASGSGDTSGSGGDPPASNTDDPAPGDTGGGCTFGRASNSGWPLLGLQLLALLALERRRPSEHARPR